EHPQGRQRQPAGVPPPVAPLARLARAGKGDETRQGEDPLAPRPTDGSPSLSTQLYDPHGPRITRIKRICADQIRESPRNPRHPRSIDVHDIVETAECHSWADQNALPGHRNELR